MTNASRYTAALAGIALLAVGPFAVVWGGVFLEHLSPWHSQFAELLFIVAGVALGVVGIWLLPIRKLFRALLIGPYVPAMTAATWFSLLPSVCAYFGDCL